MTTLLDRLRKALAPDYEVEREVASGGMGVVFLGRDVALDHRVAIKIVKPELATAAAAERFIREARILASLNHPNVIPVHRAGEAGGLSYYVMEFLQADTLEDRIARGRLPAAEAIDVARHVLSALEAAHKRGVVHRDVKPGNIFLLEDRAVLADFGIAKDTSATGPALTADGKVVGSPGYMAPEQLAGGEIESGTDLYAVGLVLYEATTGEPWPLLSDPTSGDWSKVPPELIPILRRALAWRAPDRWRSASDFRRALDRIGARRWPRVARWVAAAVVVALAALATDRLLRPGAPRAPTLRVLVRPFAVDGGADRLVPHLGDSLARIIAQSLGGSPDFTAEVGRGGTAPSAGPQLVLAGDGTLAGDSLQLTLRADTSGGAAPRIYASAQGKAAEWRRWAGDSLGRQLLLWLWTEKGGKLAADLPVGALPRTQRGLAALIGAEQLFARAQWEAAYEAYRLAIALDSSCLLCRLRLTDVGRWLSKDQDRRQTAVYRAALTSFPSHYQMIIRASLAPFDQRWRLLDSAAERAGDFGLASFIKGDEIFHRGPLAGYRRHEALAAMERATTLWPDFAPGWEHLTWIALGEGDEAVARRALDSLRRLSVGDDMFSSGVRALLDVCFQWRFTPPQAAAQYTYRMLTSPAVGRLPNLAAGARYMLTCDAPHAAVWLGEQFQRVGRADLEAPGLLAQMYGNIALGRPAAARAAGAQLRAIGAEPAVELFLAELPAALLIADSATAADTRRAWPEVRRGLESFVRAPQGDGAMRRRAAWMLSLLARRVGDEESARAYRRLLDRESEPRPLARLADADVEAKRRPANALAVTEPLLGLDSAGQAGDPFYRALLHLMRAQWHASLGDTLLAVRDLRWHENNDLRVVDVPAATPEAAEVDWSLGTLGRWRRARLLDHGRGDAEGCGAYEAVTRLWAGGEAPYGERAAIARTRMAALGCGNVS